MDKVCLQINEVYTTFASADRCLTTPLSATFQMDIFLSFAENAIATIMVKVSGVMNLGTIFPFQVGPEFIADNVNKKKATAA